MSRAPRTVGPVEPVTAVCAAIYAANLVPAYAFVFRVASTGTRFTVYAPVEDRYHLGEQYTLQLVPRDVVSLPVTVADVEFVRHCLDNAAHRWREAITEADAGATRQPEVRPAEPGHINVEPTPAGYAAAQRLFTEELDHVERLVRMLGQHLEKARAVRADGGQR